MENEKQFTFPDMGAIADPERHDNGSRRRVDRRGDKWADAHRTELPKNYYMQDLDAVIGQVSFAQNTGDTVFLEYIPPGSRDTKRRSIMQFGVVAIFDRKTSEDAAFSPRSDLSRALYLWLCRELGERQPIAPRFFYVIGRDAPPWTMIEVDIHTGLPTGQKSQLDRGSWPTVWGVLGLTEARDKIVQWLRSTAIAETRS